MIKRTLLLTKACEVRKKDRQLIVRYPDEEPTRSVPIEDIGMLIMEDQQVVISNALLMALMENNVAVLTCDTKHLPAGLLLPIHSHHAFTAKMFAQTGSSLPLRKRLWQQTVIAKILNQCALLDKLGFDSKKLKYFAAKVKSGDPDNVEGRAAAAYWDQLYGNRGFLRHRDGEMPNALYNYGYAVLLAIMARAIVGSGLLPAFGIHHRNKYNPWCLASDLMEPYRPFVDEIVLKVEIMNPGAFELSPAMKRDLLQIPVVDVTIDGQLSPLMIAAQRTSASLSACFEQQSRKLLYPLQT
ncbi:MAG TPA: type II CRISPR-associated endonuclease Cas1 [Bacteroidales bacterium]|nr:type II CRISPR-associated endonuclease Cas1 [Bacteroidales bacterium]